MYGMSATCVPNSCSYMFVNRERARPSTRHLTRRSFRIVSAQVCLTVQYMHEYVQYVSICTGNYRDYPPLLNTVKSFISFTRYFFKQRILRAFRKKFTVKFSYVECYHLDGSGVSGNTADSLH